MQFIDFLNIKIFYTMLHQSFRFFKFLEYSSEIMVANTFRTL